jgi:protein TonB
MERKKSKKADLERRRGVFFEIGFLVVLAGVLIAFEWASIPQEDTKMMQVQQEKVEEEIIPITRQQEVKPPPPPPKVVEQLNIVQNDVDIDNEINIEDVEATQDMAINMNDFSMNEEEAPEEEVFYIVEDMPKFQGGGPDKFREYIASHLQYPEVAAENGISGRVFVQFAVNSKGEVVDAKVVRGVDPALDKEALRVVTSSPKWTPGKQRGKAVKVQFTFPINFVLQ